MSEQLPISEDQRDALQEICNVAMGVAGEALAEFSGVFVELPIPKVRFIGAQNVVEALAQLRGEDRVAGVLRPYSMTNFQSYTLVVISEAGLDDLATQLGVAATSAQERSALLMRLNHTITDACIPVLQEQLEISSLTAGESELLGQNTPLQDLAVPQVANHNKLLSVEINYHLEGHPFNCDLLLLIPADAVDSLSALIDPLL